MVFITPIRLLSSAANAATSISSNTTSRSKYASHLRKAFLLRVHPDRFRWHSEHVRKTQANIVQAISARMELADFIAYTNLSIYSNDHYHHYNHHNHSMAQKEYPYFLEAKDGSLISKTIHLGDSVENVLQNMVSALSSLGGVSLPPPPPPPPSSPSSLSSQTFHDMKQYTSQPYPQGWSFVNNIMNHQSQSKEQQQSNSIRPHHKDRNLSQFLKHLPYQEIHKRKSHRLDAHAAALMARRAFHFQSIDGTRIGWSSESMAKLLSSLYNFHCEHVSKFHVSSFYPMSLEMSYDEVKGSKVCYYGGKILLNPSETPLQWLHTFMDITQDSLETVKHHQQRLLEHTKFIQESIGIRIKKGKSCDALEYHECLKHLAQTIESYASSSKSSSSSSQNNKDIALQKIQVIVESEFSCRRGMVTNEGDIRVGAGMSPQSILASISQLSERAYEKKRSEEEILTEKCHPLMEQIRAQFGIHPIYRVRVSTVTSDEMHHCLQRLLDRLCTFHNTTNNTTTSTDIFHENKQDGEESFHQRLLGHSLGITSKGQFCHLGDDGSIVVPCDFF